jgi:hypothetical protein
MATSFADVYRAMLANRATTAAKSAATLAPRITPPPAMLMPTRPAPLALMPAWAPAAR